MTWNATRLKSLRKTHALTQTDFAELLGANMFTVVNWERGGPIPPMACKLLDFVAEKLNREKQDQLQTA